MTAVLSRSLAEDLLENTIEVSEGLETHFVSDLADPQVRIQQQVLGFQDLRRGRSHSAYPTSGVRSACALHHAGRGQPFRVCL